MKEEVAAGGQMLITNLIVIIDLQSGLLFKLAKGACTHTFKRVDMPFRKGVLASSSASNNKHPVIVAH